jgi:hypothetical protein
MAAPRGKDLATPDESRTFPIGKLAIVTFAGDAEFAKPS